jgi:hypothetical protein
LSVRRQVKTTSCDGIYPELVAAAANMEDDGSALWLWRAAMGRKMEIGIIVTACLVK